MAKDEKPTQQPTPAQQQASDVIGALTFEQLLRLFDAASSKSDPALRALAETMKAAAEQQARSQRHSNMIPTGISVFNPEGDIRGIGDDRPLKPKLRDEVFFEGMRQNEEQLTPAEVNLFNSFTGSKSARNGAWEAIYAPPKGNAKKGLLQVILGIGQDVDNRMGLPPLTHILSELSTGQDATDIDKMVQQLAAMAAEIAALKAQTAVPVGA